MKRRKAVVVLAAVSALLLLLPAALLAGCGSPRSGENGAPSDDPEAAREEGFSRGKAEGYAQGLEDGRAGKHDPQVPEPPGSDEDFARGYTEGWSKGYEEGYDLGMEGSVAGEKEELAEVEAAMVAFVKQNAAPGLEFRIEGLAINGDEAVGRAVCTSERLESPYVVMRKGTSGWYGVDFGTGIEPPAWYPH